jgi:hypothetical protein
MEKTVKTTLEGLLPQYKKAPKMRGAIMRAIREHGPLAEAIVVKGQPSFSHNSHCYKMARERGWRDYQIYPGAKRRFKSQGFYNVIVRTL